MTAPAKRQPIGWMGPSQDHEGKLRPGQPRNGKWFVTDSTGRKTAGPFTGNIEALRWLDSYEIHRHGLLPPGADHDEFHRFWINTKTAGAQRESAAAASTAAVPGTKPDRATRRREPTGVT